ncbi:MAG: hypothetical protein ACRD42_04985, partial [Nitrososphaeraceae archaeon]
IPIFGLINNNTNTSMTTGFNVPNMTTVFNVPNMTTGFNASEARYDKSSITINGTTDITNFPLPPPVILNPETIPQVKQPTILLPQLPLVTNTTSPIGSPGTRAMLVLFDHVRVTNTHDWFDPAYWYLWGGVFGNVGISHDAILWTQLLVERPVEDKDGGRTYGFWPYPKAIAIEVPTVEPSEGVRFFAVVAEGFDDDCRTQISLSFCPYNADLPYPVYPTDDLEVLGKVFWVTSNLENWGMNNPVGLNLGQHTVRSSLPTPFGTRSDYELTFSIYDCGAPTCTVINFYGQVHILDPPAVLAPSVRE